MDQGAGVRAREILLAARLWTLFSQLEPVTAVIKHVETQEERHRSRTFQEEYREFLRKHNVHYEER